MRAPSERPAALVGFGALCAAISFGLAALAVGSGADGALPDAEGTTAAASGPVRDSSSTTGIRGSAPDGGGDDSTTSSVPQPIPETTATPPPPPPTTAPAPPPQPPPAPVSPPPLAPVTTAPDGAEPAHSNRVFVFGDSVVLGAASALPGALVGWDVVVDAAESRFEHQAPDILRARRADIGRVAVVLIGHNSSAGYDHEIWFRRMMDELVGVERVVFLTAVEWGPGPTEFNEDLRRLAPEYPAIVVADWNALSRANPGYTVDGLHLLGPGRDAMARLVADAVGPPPA